MHNSAVRLEFLRRLPPCAVHLSLSVPSVVLCYFSLWLAPSHFMFPSTFCVSPFVPRVRWTPAAAHSAVYGPYWSSASLCALAHLVPVRIDTKSMRSDKTTLKSHEYQLFCTLNVYNFSRIDTLCYFKSMPLGIRETCEPTNARNNLYFHSPLHPTYRIQNMPTLASPIKITSVGGLAWPLDLSCHISSYRMMAKTCLLWCAHKCDSM